MFKKKSSRHSLALFVALALGSGTLLTAAPTHAADVSGNDIVIDNTHAPSNNVVDPADNIVGTAAGFIKEEANNGNVTRNTLTFKNIHYTKHLYGGLTFGTGNVTGNRVIVNPAAPWFPSPTDGIFGGAANGGGNVEYNHAEFNGDQLNGDLIGGMTKGTGTGIVQYNTALLKNGGPGAVYGGIAAAGTNGDVLYNQATIENGNTNTVYGGYADGNGNVKNNIVTIKGGIMTGVEGGHADGTGEISGNTVNLGDGTSAMPANYTINGTIYGGRNEFHPEKVLNNTLNVNANAKAGNIKNFSTINFNFNAYTDTNRTLLELTLNKTKLNSLSQIYVKNAKVGRGTLMWNSNEFEITDSTKVGRTEEKTETIIEKDSSNKAINYRTYQFKDSTTTDFEGTNIWGGRSTLGNTTTGNKVTVSGNNSGKDAYGGWTSGTGSTATDADATNHSIGNKITLEGAASEVHHMTGGSTAIADGKATDNHAVLDGGRVTGNLAGGRAHDGEVSGNIVDIKNGGRVDGTTHGGITGGTGKAEKNTVTLTDGTLHGDIYGGVAASGDAVENTVNIHGGSAAGHDVYGGFSTNGNATGNTVTITGGSVRNVDGGRSTNGDATGNIVNIGSADAAFGGSITGIINGGSGMNGAKDYRTGNKLNVYDNVSPTNISNFAEINFHFNSHVNPSASFLSLNDSGGTTIKKLSDLHLYGDYARKGTLIKNTSGTITISEGGDRLFKTDENKEFTLAKSLDSKSITYEGYAFAHQTAPTTVTEGSTTNTWGGRSIGGNSTRHNKITVGSGSHTNIYGGWTAGSGTTATDQDNSYENEVTLDGATTEKLYGGYTDNVAGKAEKNILKIQSGTVSDDIYGGIANKTAGTGDVKENIVNISGGTVNNVYGGYSAGSGEVSGNKVTATGGTGFNDVRGGYSTSGAANGNKVTLGAFNTGAVTGGHGTTADGNEVTLTGTTATSVTGGEGATTKKNIVNLNGGVTVNGTIKGGTGTPGAAGEENTLNVKGTNAAQSISGFQKLHFDTDGASATNPLLKVTGTDKTKVDWEKLEATGTATGITLLQNDRNIILSNYTYSNQVKSKLSADGKSEYDIEIVAVAGNARKITYNRYQFEGNPTLSRSANRLGVMMTWGGLSLVGNTTTKNIVTLDHSVAGVHQYIYGGWSRRLNVNSGGDGDSTANELTIAKTAVLAGSNVYIYGGYAEVGKAEGNTVTIQRDVNGLIQGGHSSGSSAIKNIVHVGNVTITGEVVGGSSFDTANENEVHLTGTTVTGDVYGGAISMSGEGTTAKDNKVYLNGGVTIQGGLYGGDSEDISTGNKLFVKGKDNKAGTISNIQNMNFDATGLAKDDKMLEATGTAQTDVNWATLKATGTAAKPLTLFKNENGINLAGYTGAVKSETTDTTETNIDVRKTGARITEITYEGYQFKDVRQATTVTDAGVTNTFGGRSKAGNSTRHNEISVESGAHTNVYGGWTSGAGTTAEDKNNSYKNKVKVSGSANVTNTVYGGFTEAADGKATGNEVTVTGGTVHDVVGGEAKGEASGNTVTVSANANAVTGGRSTGDASGNIVNLANAMVNSVTGGEGATTNNNTINLNGNAQVTGTLTGGSQASGIGNTLNVKGKDNKAGTISNIQNMNFDATGLAKDDKMLEITGAAQSDVDWTTLRASGTATKPLTLLKNDNGINLAGYTGAVKSETGDTTETNIDVRKTGTLITEITYEGYQFKDVRQATTVTDAGVTNTFGGRSKAGNSTRDNEISVESGTHTNVYGGWTSGSGTTAADKDTSYKNKVTVNGSANVTNTVYGGFTEAASGRATGNEVTIENAVHDVVGGQAVGEASGNTVTVNANANAVTGGRSTGDASGNIVNLANATIANVTGGEGATTNNNTINLNGNAQITGTLTGGSQANGTGNTLNVKGKDNKAGTISNIQNMNFDATGLAKGDTMLEATGAAQSDVDWTTLRASGAAAKPLTLLKNDSGINLAGYTGAVKSETTDTTETNIDVRKTGGKVTEITYEGYQFKGVTQATTDGDTFAGISKAGNSTRENEITVAGGIHANVYGGWTTGSGTTAADKDASYKNKVTVNGSANVTGTVYGGFTNVAGGKATANEVTVTGGTVHDVVGGEAKGEASGNTVTVSANAGVVTGGRSTGDASGNIVNLSNATVNSVTGGEGATTNNNTINLNGNAQVTGALKGGSQANGTGNTLNVKGKDNKAGTISNVQNMNFDATGLAKGDTMLEATDAGETDVDWTTLRASGMATKPLTLLKNDNGINLAGYTGAVKSETGDTTETNIDVRKTGALITEITYEGYQFKDVRQATTVTDAGVTNTFGGRSKAGNSTRENEINVESGTHANVYGGWTSGSGTTAADKGASYKNKVKVSGSASVTGTVYGGFAEAAGGKATSNEVTVTGGTVHDVVGGEAKGEASGNTVTVSTNAGVVTGGRSAGEASGNIVNLANAAVNSVTGGEGAATNNNTVNLNGGANVTGVLKGGSAANGTGNTLNVNGVNRAGSVTGFQKMNFDATGAPADAAMLHTTGATDVNWETLTVKNAVASEKPLTLLENANGINISGRTGDAARSELNADATMETNIDVMKSGSKVTAITYEGYTFKGAAKATTYGADTWAGRSKAGNTTQDNKLTLDDASKTYANVYGGWTSGTGTKAAADKQNNSLNNTVDYTAGTVTGTLYGGYAAAGEASDNTVNLGAITTAANIYGGFGTATKNNTINLKGARITGTVYGGSDANGTGNTLAVYKPSEVHDFAGVQNLHFYTDEMAAGATTPMLKLGTATKDIRGLNIGVARSGAAPKLIKGDKILLMKTAGGALATDAAIQNKVEGMQGVSRRYEYEIKQEATGELTATVTKAGFAEQAKSLVETRAGLAGFVNQGADYLVQDGLAAAEMSVSASDADKGGKNAQRQGASSDGAAYQLWAGAGANSMRAESGSYVDSKGWNLGVGWAREDVQKDGAKVLFSPFVEYGRGTYDSYLDDGTHGSGKVSYIGAGILGKLTQKDGLWLEGSLRAGRSKSDYSANLSGTAASYDGSNTYYGAHLGAGKTFAIKEDSSIDAYARYFWSHQNSMTATLNTGDVYEFGSVNSQRLRLGLRYSLKDKTTGEFYAGLAWEHEFAGKAGATYQGDAAPSPSLKGSSTMLELGYRFMPKNSRVSYDLHLNGWQGKRKGITGGASVKWAF